MYYFQRNERFCEYTQKVFVLENVINFVPRIFFGLAIRFIRLEDSEELSGIIEANPGIARYFCEYAEIVEYWYKGGIVKIT